MARLQLTHINKAFGETKVLKDVSLEIRDGEFLTLVGPSGCGKTTLLRIIAGLDYADRGTILIDELRIDELAPKQRDVAMVFQSYALYPYMTVRENIALPLTMRKLSWLQRLPLIGQLLPGASTARQEIVEIVTQTAAPLGLSALLDRRPAQLSGGQRQRVALGRAMVRQPKVFLMDEPLSNLDAKMRVSTRAEIAQLHRTLGTTFVYVTHDQVEAMTMSDRVAVMMEGEILQLDTPQEIYDNPLDLRVAEFIGTPKINVLPASVCNGGLSVGGVVWPLDVEHETAAGLQLAVRPEWWSVHASSAHDAADGACVLSGTIVHKELLGAETLLYVKTDAVESTDPAEANVAAKLAPVIANHFSIGQVVSLHAQHMLAFDGQGKRLPNVSRKAVARPLEVAFG
jgi:multiple sugar transport system ATP-binding protein